MPYYPCGYCTIHVLETDEAIQCDGKCSFWYHRECLGMTVAAYLKLSNSQEDWLCRNCSKLENIKHEKPEVTPRYPSSEIAIPEMPGPKTKCRRLDRLKGSQRCVFCLTSEVDEFKLGPVYKLGDLITHYYCLLLSCNLMQNGSDKEGILGFLANDIIKEVKRGSRLHCIFCKLRGATVGCDVSKCKVTFHLPCGMKNGTLSQFAGTYRSFCVNHRPVQQIDEAILAEARNNTTCILCQEDVIPRPVHNSLWAPCCKVGSFFHRECVQKMALSAGYFFRCPLCNNETTFKEAMNEFGIFIPYQDASWELEPDAFTDLLTTHKTCDLSKCLCPTGRDTNITGTRWELRLCNLCGSQGAHVGCGKLGWKKTNYECEICSKPTPRPRDEAGPSTTTESQPSQSSQSSQARTSTTKRLVLSPLSDNSNHAEYDLTPPNITAKLYAAGRRSSLARSGGTKDKPKKMRKRSRKRKALSPASSHDENLKKLKPCRVMLPRLLRREKDSDDEVERPREQ